MDKINRPVAVFDSGVGGISVLKELVRTLPNEDFLYYGDSANAPYGTKTTEQVVELTSLHIGELIAQGVKAVVIACNTATSAAADILREKYPNIPIIGIEPALKTALMLVDHPKVLVMATPMTLRLEKFHKLLDKYEYLGQVYLLPCPGLAEMVEQGELRGEKIERFLNELLADWRDNKVDAAVLGCTHYPFVKPVIASVLGDKVKIVDGSIGTAKELKRRLRDAGLLNETGTGSVVFENSRDTDEELELCRKLFEINYQ